MEFYVFCIFIMLMDPVEQKVTQQSVSKVAEEVVCC